MQYSFIVCCYLLHYGIAVSSCYVGSDDSTSVMTYIILFDDCDIARHSDIRLMQYLRIH